MPPDLAAHLPGGQPTPAGARPRDPIRVVVPARRRFPVRFSCPVAVDMADVADVPADVLLFLADRIDSVPHLEALLLLWRSGGRQWSAEEVAARVYVDLDTAHRLLLDLERQGLIAAAPGDPPRYAYDPSWDTRAEFMPRLAAEYDRKLVRIASFLHSKASPGVREFARAFKLTKD
jgi:hypothetical protein